MSPALTAGQQDSLHKSILEYLKSSGFEKTYKQFKEEAPGLTDYESDSKPPDLLVKKWTSVIRLQRKVMDLEARLVQALENKDHGGNIGPSKRTNPDWLPNANSVKHILTGHRMRVTAVAFHPIYSALASASEDCTIKVWDWERGELEKTLTGHTRLITDCEYDSRGKNLVSASYDLFIKLWSVDDDYKNFATLRGHDHSVSSARFSPDDTKIISCSRDETVRIWDISTTHCVKVIQPHNAWIRGALPSADGRLIITCSDDHTARIIEADTGALRSELRGHEHFVTAAVFVPASATLAIRQLIDPEGKTQPRVSKSEASTLYAVTASRDKKIILWDALRGISLQTFVGHNNWINALVFHPSGNHLLSASDDHTFRIWDLRTGRCVQTVEAHDHFVLTMAWGRQTVSAEASDSKGGESSTVQRTINVLATGGNDKTIKIWYP